jgi:hypothetical protein
MTPQGVEWLTHDWTENLTLDGSKPLSLLKHVGGKPIFATVARTKYSPESYANLVKWIRKAYEYAEEFGAGNLPEETKQPYETFKKEAFPLLKRWDETTAKLFLPAFQDSQGGFVLDAKQTSKQWFEAMPKSAEPLPMIEMAFVFSLSDAVALKKAMSEYRLILNDALARVSEHAGGLIPKVEMPTPETKKLGDGEMFFFPIPKEVGFDPRFLPNATLTNSLLVLTLSEDHSKRLIASTPFQGEGLLEKGDRAIAAFTYFDWAGFVDAIKPWTEIGVEVAYEKMSDEDVKNAPKKEEVLLHLRTILDVAKAFRSYSAITYMDGKAMVTHSRMLLQDR